MGRRSWNDNPDRLTCQRFYLQHIPLDSGGYDRGGAYWGVGRRLYGYCSADDSVNGFTRASNHAEAKQRVLMYYPNAMFFN
jgi:hypothetical protein